MESGDGQEIDIQYTYFINVFFFFLRITYSYNKYDLVKNEED
jgi:hypothetical protein